MNNELSVSVIIRNRNESEFLPDVLKALSQQDYPYIDVIVVDNESSDNSTDIAKQWGAEVINISKNDFTYGRALNTGIERAKGDLCLILSAHSMLLGTHFVSDCVLPFADNEIAGVRCMYAGKKSDIQNVLCPEILSDPGDIRKIIAKGPLASGCMIRKSVWQKIPFNEELEAAEEKIWTLEVLKNGYKTFASSPAAYLYLKQISPVQNLKKTYREIVAVYKHTGVKIGFANETPLKSFLMFVYTFIKPAPLAFLEEIYLAFLRTRFTISLRKNAKKPPKSGSII